MTQQAISDVWIGIYEMKADIDKQGKYLCAVDVNFSFCLSLKLKREY